MTKLKIAAATAVILIVGTSVADARRHYYTSYRHAYRPEPTPASAFPAIAFQYYPNQTRQYRRQRHSVFRSSGQTVAHPSGCPGRAFCGCGVSVKVFGKPVRNLYLARNWYKFPRTAAAPGMVAVRNHHVMYIQSLDANGNATVYDPNSGGHQTRIHTRSLSGYTVVNPYGKAVAGL